ncbi:DUF4350 domain-containing protein [Aureitalea sp. L0-47]|uniref:DUF4350 domain-containing protein n=1 Tax=Aureitalea sp. L0-47 TaxID=2816962 RepID=UPI002238BF73|nr:DUF4350 domain-containing protein [Aureitalea sp. L0-47]MCW5519794.1 DUF4350 domain-containing protein [Aureitalea sp. L0-47]
MSKFQKLIFLGLIIVVASLVYIEASKPEPVNWFPSYTTSDKIPLGTYVLDELLSEKLEDNYRKVNIPPYEKMRDPEFKGNYFFVNNSVDFDPTEVEKILDWVSEGNNLFVSANYHSYSLMDTLKLEMRNDWAAGNLGSEPLLDLSNPYLKKKKPYHIKHDFDVRYFEKIDTLNQVVLGEGQLYLDTLAMTDPKVNFIKAPVGDGSIFLHAQPEIFSNYFLLTDDYAAHTEQVLSYVNNDLPFYYDNYYKTGKAVNLSPLYILLNNKYLKWAYYFVLIGLFLYVIFEGKRKQRKIPIIKPLRNQTYEYTRTIAGMYLDKKEYHNVARKQISLFMDYVRTQYRVPTNIINSRFFESLAARSGNTFDDTRELFVYLEKMEHKPEISKQELKELHFKIESFKQQIDGKS